MNAPAVAITCIALAFAFHEAGADVHVSAQLDHLVISVVDLTPNNTKIAGYTLLQPIDLQSQLGVAGIPGSDRIATFHDRDSVQGLAPRYAMDDVLSIGTSQARITNDGNPDLLRASAGTAIAGGLANGQVTGVYLFDMLPQTQLIFTAHASLTGDSLSGERVGGDSGFAFVQFSTVSIPYIPETAQAIYLGQVWPTGKKSDSWSGTISFTLTNSTNAPRKSVEVDTFLMLEAAPAANVIPEPSDGILLLVGVACVGIAMRRRSGSSLRAANE